MKQVDTLLKSDEATLVFEAIGDDKVRVTCQSWEDARVILPEQALLVVAQGKTLNVMRTDRPAEQFFLRKLNAIRACWC